jgi:hypothetical protein
MTTRLTSNDFKNLEQNIIKNLKLHSDLKFHIEIFKNDQFFGSLDSLCWTSFLSFKDIYEFKFNITNVKLKSVINILTFKILSLYNQCSTLIITDFYTYFTLYKISPYSIIKFIEKIAKHLNYSILMCSNVYYKYDIPNKKIIESYDKSITIIENLKLRYLLSYFKFEAITNTFNKRSSNFIKIYIKKI